VLETWLLTVDCFLIVQKCFGRQKDYFNSSKMQNLLEEEKNCLPNEKSPNGTVKNLQMAR